MDKIVLSNHNPDALIERHMTVRDPRVVTINQDKHRSCGFRWTVAAKLDAEHLIVIDDDIFASSKQIAALARSLARDPQVPHGFSGMLHLQGDKFEYRQRVDLVVDYLCEVYAVTRSHVRRYQLLLQHLSSNAEIAEKIARAADFILISRSGKLRAKIINVGHLLRCATFNQPGVAIHTASDFHSSMVEVSAALNAALVQEQRVING